MDTMKSVAVLEKGKVAVIDNVPIPYVGDYDVLLKVHACGFCSGTDFQVINGTLEEKAGFLGFPTLLGHEGSGEVIEIGEKVRNIKIGDRFIHPNLRVNPGAGYHRSFGGMSEYGLVADHQAMLEDGFKVSDLPFYKKFAKFPTDIDFIDAGVLLSLSECNSAAKNFDVGPGQDILVYGAGPMGIALSMFMKFRGAKSVTIIDEVEKRLECAKSVAKVDRVVDFSKENVDEALKDTQFDLVVDAVGKASIIIEGSGRLKPGGKVGSLGVLKHDDRFIDASLLKDNTNLHMLNFPYGEYDIMDNTIELIQNGKVNPKDFYSHVVPFQKIDEALELVRTKTALKVILIFDE